MSSNPPASVLCQARGLCFGFDPASALFGPLDFQLIPGLTLLRGGDGRGKTTLLRLMAGTLAPTAGQLDRQARSLSHEEPADPLQDHTVAQAWLASRAAHFPDWQPDIAAALVAAFQLHEHLHKPLYTLSTGSRRKLGLVAAAASNAQLTLLETPLAALDASSRRVLTELLIDAADSHERAWVLADYELPAGLAGVRLAGLIDLGD